MQREVRKLLLEIYVGEVSDNYNSYHEEVSDRSRYLGGPHQLRH